MSLCRFHSVSVPAQVDIFTIFGLFTSSIFGSCYWLSDKISTNCYPLGVLGVCVCVCVLSNVPEKCVDLQQCGDNAKFYQTMPFHLCHSLLFMSLRSDVCVLHSRLLSGYEFNSIRSFSCVASTTATATTTKRTMCRCFCRCRRRLLSVHEPILFDLWTQNSHTF